MGRAIYACDVGSVRAGTFAWARALPGAGNPCASRDIGALATRLVEDLNASMSVALGFECPLFMPVPEESERLNRGRQGEGNRAMFAPAGAAVATQGLQEAAWILRHLRDRVSDPPPCSLDWCTWPPQDGGPRFLLWEAFVSGQVHSSSHERDAATAAVFFRNVEQDLGAMNAVTADQPLSMIHAAALWAGLAADLDRLRCPCLVLKPNQRYEGVIDPA